jgi:hypothetical protein
MAKALALLIALVPRVDPLAVQALIVVEALVDMEIKASGAQVRHPALPSEAVLAPAVVNRSSTRSMSSEVTSISAQWPCKMMKQALTGDASTTATALASGAAKFAKSAPGKRLCRRWDGSQSPIVPKKGRVLQKFCGRPLPWRSPTAYNKVSKAMAPALRHREPPGMAADGSVLTSKLATYLGFSEPQVIEAALRSFNESPKWFRFELMIELAPKEGQHWPDVWVRARHKHSIVVSG